MYQSINNTDFTLLMFSVVRDITFWETDIENIVVDSSNTA